MASPMLSRLVAPLGALFLLTTSHLVLADSLCSAGYFGPENSAVCQPAPPGYYVPVAGAITATPAPAGSFVSGFGATEATLAAAGSYVPTEGQATSTLAEPGFYVPVAGAIAATPASAGSFVSEEGATAATFASPGYYVPTEGQASQTLAKPGSYVATFGASSATLAPAGSFVSRFGATEATLAAAGSYVPVAGATEATLAPAGSFVSESGAVAPTPAPPGAYVPNEGQTYAIIATPGYFVSEVGATSQTIAPVGFYTSDTGAIAAIPAAPGTYVPTEGSTHSIECPQDSASFGGAPACRSGFISMNNPETIGPMFDSNFGQSFTDNNDIDLGQLETNNLYKLEFEIFNAADFLGITDDLTSLSLLNASFSGVNADLFSLEGFTPSVVLGEQESTSFIVNMFSMIETDFIVDLTFSTDQFASFGKAGQDFVFTLQGQFVDAVNQVSAPATLGVFLVGLLFIQTRRRGSL